MEPFLNSLRQHGPGVLFRQRADLSFEFASPRLEDLTGRAFSEWERQPALFLETIHESDREELKKQLLQAGRSPSGITSEFRIRHAVTGRVSYISEFRFARRGVTGQVEGYEGFWLDITRQMLSERRLAMAAWKETLGLMTLGLAHDFNNVIAGVLGLSESFLAQIEPEHPFYEGLNLMKRKTQHAAQVVQRIAHLCRSETGLRGYHNLNELVKESTDLLRTLMPCRIELKTQLDISELALYVDAVELQQVLIGLALNAVDAMPEQGRLSIDTSRHETPPQAEHFVGTLPRSPLTCLAVSDTGVAIKAHWLPLVFDPCFSIPPLNRGSGLALYNARLFAEKHQGAVSVESQEGVGTTFRVWLPLADFTEADRAMELSNQRSRSILVAGHPGRQLKSTAEFLRRHNYHVVVGGGDAEELLCSSDYQFDAVLLLADPQDPIPASLVRFIRQQKLPLKLIVKTEGCNLDEFEPGLFEKVDLIISSDGSEELVLDRLGALF